MGLDRWLFGGLIFEGPPSMRRNFAFFFLVCLLQLAVVCNCSLCINHHSKGHQQRSGCAAKSRCTFAMCTASWYLCMLLARSGCLIASSNNVREILAVHFSPNLRHQECWCTHFIPGPREHSTWKALIDWFKRVWACSPSCTQTNRNGYLCPACFWWIQEYFLCPSCPTLFWKCWFDGFNNVAGG